MVNLRNKKNMEYRNTMTISKRDLKRMMEAKGIKSFYQLSKVSGVSEQVLSRWTNNHIKLSENAWNKIKVCL